MTTPTDHPTAVRTSIKVSASPDKAFEVFTAGINSWWNRDQHLLSGDLKVVDIEPRVGGRVWEENDAGEVCTWGHVLAWDPPRTFAFSWLIGPEFDVPADNAAASEVTVTFTPTDDGTRVELVHDKLDAHGSGWKRLRDSVGGAEGWPADLRTFAALFTDLD